MDAVSLGPLMLAGERFAAVVGIGLFLLATALTRRFDPGIERWAGYAFAAGLIGARLGHVGENYKSFLEAPYRVFAFWQGGFSPTWGAVAIALVSLLVLRRRAAIVWSSVSLAMALVGWAGLLHTLPRTPPRKLPTIVLERVGGSRLELAAFKGAPMVVNLWASWCPPCRREMPLLAKAADSSRDVAFVFVNQGEAESRIAAYLRSARLALRHVLVDRESAVAAHYETPGLPATLFIASDGRLQTVHFGEISPEALAENLSKLR